jgi:16S rRNA (adenine1518-N6/adenine1519-N6)-dimethyltransferase
MKRGELKTILGTAGIKPRKSAGQNFLMEESLAHAIAGDAEIDGDDVVLEIGPGLGMLTQFLTPLARHVVAVELDERLLAIARERLAGHENLTLIHADALASKSKLNPVMLDGVRERLAEGEGGALRVVANLPYNVATPLVVGLLGADLPLACMTVMVQLEAAERFAATVGDPQYGSVSLLCSALCDDVQVIRHVPREVFHPRPKVQSAIVRFRPAPQRLDGFPELSELVRGVFNYRRKTLNSALKFAAKRHPELAWARPAAEASEVDLTTRTDEVPLESFQAILRERKPLPE